jgi:hypothetical protein
MPGNGVTHLLSYARSVRYPLECVPPTVCRSNFGVSDPKFSYPRAKPPARLYRWGALRVQGVSFSRFCRSDVVEQRAVALSPHELNEPLGYEVFVERYCARALPVLIEPASGVSLMT